MQTGAQFPKYGNFLDDEGEFKKGGRKARTYNELDDPGNYEDELNKLAEENYDDFF